MGSVSVSSAVLKGTVFELEISAALAGIDGATVLSNLKVYSNFLGRFTEIDRLLIAPWGVYCIEAKSFNSALEGKIDDSQWTGKTGGSSTRVYNPVFQNFEHIRSLNSILRKIGKKPLHMYNAVVVPDSCRIISDSDMVMTRSRFLDRVISDSCSTGTLNVKEVFSNLSKIRTVYE
jgi:hypothetical protein